MSTPHISIKLHFLRVTVIMCVDTQNLTLSSLPLPPPSLSSPSPPSLLQLLVGDEVVLTFACSSAAERDEWTSAFDIFRQMALPAPEHPALQTVVSTDGECQSHTENESKRKLNKHSNCSNIHWHVSLMTHQLACIELCINYL